MNCCVSNCLLDHLYAIACKDTWLFLLGDGAVYVRYDDSVVPVPQVDGGLAATGALVLCGHTEHHLVGSLTQV